MTTRKLAAGWMDMGKDAGRGNCDQCCSRRGRYLLDGALPAVCCDSPACVEAMGVFAAEEPAPDVCVCASPTGYMEETFCRACKKRRPHFAFLTAPLAPEPTPGALVCAAKDCLEAAGRPGMVCDWCAGLTEAGGTVVMKPAPEPTLGPVTRDVPTELASAVQLARVVREALPVDQAVEDRLRALTDAAAGAVRPFSTPGPVGEDARLRDCGQAGVCAISPGCLRHWEERNRELVAEVAALKVALDEAAELLTGMAAASSRQMGKTAVSDWLTRYAALKGPALEPRAARGQKGKR